MVAEGVYSSLRSCARARTNEVLRDPRSFRRCHLPFSSPANPGFPFLHSTCLLISHHSYFPFCCMMEGEWGEARGFDSMYDPSESRRSSHEQDRGRDHDRGRDRDHGDGEEHGGRHRSPVTRYSFPESRSRERPGSPRSRSRERPRSRSRERPRSRSRERPRERLPEPSPEDAAPESKYRLPFSLIKAWVSANTVRLRLPRVFLPLILFHSCCSPLTSSSPVLSFSRLFYSSQFGCVFVLSVLSVSFSCA